MLFPGITGVISLLVAFVAFDSLPLNWGAVALLVLALGLFIAELYTPGTGIATIGGIVAFVTGSLTLYQPFTQSSPAMPDLRVSPWLVFTMTAAPVASLVFVIPLINAQRAPVRTGIQGLVGQSGRPSRRCGWKVPFASTANSGMRSRPAKTSKPAPTC